MKTNFDPHCQPTLSEKGFSMIELVIVLIILLVLSAMSIPGLMGLKQRYQVSGDTRGISTQLNLARMRAASGYTHARLYADLAGNTFHVEVWNKAGNGGSGCWQTDGDSNACTQTSSPLTLLAPADSFGFGSISSGPTAATSSIAQAPTCTTGVGGSSPGTTISNTSCIEFNSRGYPVDSSDTIVASDAIYVANSQNLYSAVTVPIAGQPTAYSYNGSSWAQY